VGYTCSFRLKYGSIYGGDRGATSVEYFLAKGYAVVFMYRVGTKFPSFELLVKLVRIELMINY
jgi:hypothetical protein